MVSNMLRYLAPAAALVPAAMGAVHSHFAAVPQGWEVAETANTQQVFTLGLARQNIDQLESMLLDISTPGNANYGKFLDDDTVSSTFAPSAEAVSAVTSWLKANGISNYQVSGSYIDFAADVPTTNKLLGASYQTYTKGGQTKLRSLSYTLPDEIEPYVSVVDPSTFFGGVQAFGRAVRSALATPATPVRRAAENPNAVSVDASCATSVTPSCLKQLYSIGDYKADPKSGSRVGFGSFLGQSALESDVLVYEQLFDLPQQNFSVTVIAGGTNDQDSSTAQDGEANLDAQNIMGIASPLPLEEFITGGLPPFIPNIDQPTAADNQNEPYLPYYRYLLSQPIKDIPQVISNSYGDEEDSVPLNYATEVCNLIGIMGLRGVTIFESSGDLGVGAGCLAPDNKTVEFNAIFPATCPYLTSVGGTTGISPEVAWDGSSGGFSKYFPRPFFQAASFAAYIATVAPSTVAYYSHYTNFQGRGFPDVSSQSLNYEIVFSGQVGGDGGTSAASPVWAGVAALLNDARLRAGKPSLGWLNPLLYAFAPLEPILNDITEGYSIGCNGADTQSGGPEPAGSGIVPWARWNTTRGWDPVTGYGTPNFEELRELVLTF